jgi:hypothetical protein
MTRVQEISLPVCLEGIFLYLSFNLAFQFLFIIASSLLTLDNLTKDAYCKSYCITIQFLNLVVFHIHFEYFILLLCLSLHFVYSFDMAVRLNFDDPCNSVTLQVWMLWSRLKLAPEKLQLFWYTLVLLMDCILFRLFLPMMLNANSFLLLKQFWKLWVAIPLIVHHQYMFLFYALPENLLVNLLLKQRFYWNIMMALECRL